MTNQEKGRELETAVRQIYDLILSNADKKQIKEFVIYPNYRDIKFYEIDLYIQIEYTDDTHSVQIVECKNWDAKTVERKDITDFVEKVKISVAEKGYFVAKSFTEGANWRIGQENNVMEVLVQNIGAVQRINWLIDECVNAKGEKILLKSRVVFEKSFSAEMGDRIRMEFYNENRTYLIGTIVELRRGDNTVHQFTIENVAGEYLSGVPVKSV